MPLNGFRNPTLGIKLMLGFGLIGLALVAAPLAMYMVESGEAIESVRLKQVGIAPARALLKVVHLLQQHRGFSTNVLGGNATMEAQRAAIQTATDKTVETFDVMVTSDISDPAFTATWRKAIKDWRELARSVSLRSITGQESFTRHTALIDEDLKLLDLLMDYFGLSYDPSGNDYHLVMATLAHMPHLTEFLGQMRAHGSLSLALKRIVPEGRRTMVGLISNVEREHRDVGYELDKATTRNPHLTAELRDIALTSQVLTQKALYLARTYVAEAEKLRYLSTEYWAVLTLAIDGQFTLIDKGMAVLERTLEERVTALQDAQFKTIGLTVVVIAFAVWLGALMIRAIKQDMAVLQQREEAEREYGKELEVTVERLKQTHAKLEVHQKRWELLHRLDVLLSRSLRLEEIYPAFARAVKELVPYDRIGVVVPDGTLFRMALSVAEPPLVAHQGELWPRAEGCALHCVLAQKSPKLVRDLQVETTCWDGVYRAQEGVRSIACVPLLAGGEAVGVLCLD